MAASKYKVKYTSDISQHKLAMTEYKAQVKHATDGVKGMLKFGIMGGGMIGGAGVAGISTYVTKLGAEMERTRTAFTVFLGDVDKANRAIDKLMDFSDITPFTPDVVLAAGRGLLAVGVSVDDLCSKLTMLGDISSGVNMPLQDMVAIYTKGMNKGKIQAEEINQLAERGVPIVQALAKIYGISTTEVMKWGEQGKLTFAGLEAGLQRLANGKYAGMMAKQSQTLIGLWSTLQGKIARIGGEIGELANPEIKRVLGDIINELDRLKQTGELQENIRNIADAMKTVVITISDLVTWIARNRELLASLGLTAVSIMLWSKLNSLVATTGTLMRALAAAKTAGTLTETSTAAALLTTNLKSLATGAAGISSTLNAIALAGATAFVGWQIGKAIADLIDLEEKLTDIMKAQGQLASGKSSGKYTSSAFNTAQFVGDMVTFGNAENIGTAIAGSKKVINMAPSTAEQAMLDRERRRRENNSNYKSSAQRTKAAKEAAAVNAVELATAAAAAQNEKVDKYLKTLEQKLKLQQLINQQKQREAAIQQALNAAEQKAGTLTDAQKKRVAEAAGKNFDAKASGGVSNYLRDMERQLRIQSLLNQGKQREAAIQEAIDSAKQKAGGKLTDAQRAQVSDAAGRLYDSQFQRQYFFAPEQQTITDSVQRMGGYIGNAAPDLGMNQIPDIVKRIETIAGDLNSKVKDPNMISDNDGGDWQL